MYRRIFLSAIDLSIADVEKFDALKQSTAKSFSRRLAKPKGECRGLPMPLERVRKGEGRRERNSGLRNLNGSSPYIPPLGQWENMSLKSRLRKATPHRNGGKM